MSKTAENTADTDVRTDTAADSPMKTRQFFGDIITVVSVNIIVNLIGRVTYFYTDIIGLAAGTMGTVLLVSKLFDAFSDVGMGVILDRTKSKYGKARPWFIRMALPSLICIILLFTTPSEVSDGFKIVYAAVTNILLLAGIYTAIAVSSGSLLSLETNNPHERAKMGIGRLVCAYAAGLSVSALMIPATNRLGGGQRAWIIMGAVYGVVCAVSLVAAFFCVKENNSVPLVKEERISPLKGIALLLKNRYWVLALAVNVLIQFIYAVGVAETYYMKYIFGDENLVASAGLFRLLFVGAGFVLTGLLIKRLGKRNLILVGTVVSVAGCVLRAANPGHLMMNLISIGITTLGGVPALALIGAMVADSIDYGEWKTGVRTVGLASSSHSFAGKLGSALFAGLAGWLLGLSGYDGMLPAQPSAAIDMIKVLNIQIPLICYSLIFVLMLFYRLDKDHGRISADLAARRQSG